MSPSITTRSALARASRRLAGAARALLIIACAGVVLALVQGCRRETRVERGIREQILHRGMGPEPAYLDPHLATGTNDYTVLSALFEGLVAEHPVDLRPVPGVAESWDVSPDGLVYTFHLRANARWSNGDPVTAQDFVDSWRRALTASLAADNATLLYVLQGAEAFHKGQQPDFTHVGVAAPDARTLRVTLEHPAAYFLSLLQHWIWWPVHLPTVRAHGGVADRGNRWTAPESWVGNGPFVLREWRAGQRLVVEKSPTYWDAPQVRLQGIHFHVTDDVNAEERAFRAGQLHLTEAIPVSKIDSYRERRASPLRIDPYLGTYFYRINVRQPFLNVPLVRRALSLAVDRVAIVEKILRGGQKPATAFTPPGTDGYEPPEAVVTDLPAARELLAQAGYPEGRGAPKIELLFNTSENHRVIAEAIQAMWSHGLGLQVDLVNMENKSVLDARRTGSYQVLRSNWIGDYADPLSFLSVWRSDSGNNYTGWSNSAYDQGLFEASRTTDPAARRATLRKAEELLLAEAPLIPIFFYTHAFLLHPAVRGWHPTLLDHHPYKHVWLE